METYNTLNENPIIVPTKEHRDLAIFVGTWEVEGTNMAVNSLQNEMPIKGVQSYEWLPGGYFLVYKWDRHFGIGNHIGMGMICHDLTNDTFSITNYDNLGFAKTYTITHKENIWKFSGEQQRATIKFTNDGGSFTENWEIKSANGDWNPLCRFKATKLIIA